MLKEKQFRCDRCSIVFRKRTRSTAKYCPDCRKIVNVEKQMRHRAKKNPNVRVGVGSGGNQHGIKNPFYKDGKTIGHKSGKDLLGIYRKKRRWSESCEFCESNTNLEIHHIDTNRANNKPSNLMLVCRSCHKKIHWLYKKTMPK